MASESIYYVCNPTTKQFTTLPQINAGDNKSILGINLAFDPFKTLHYTVICFWTTKVPDSRDPVENVLGGNCEIEL